MAATPAAAELRRLQRSLRSLPRRLVDTSAKTIRTGVTKTLKRDTGGDMRLSGHPRGRPLKVDVKVSGETVVTGIVSPGPTSQMGPWSWLQHGTGAPGPTRAKHTWSDPAEKAVDEVRKSLGEEFRRAVHEGG